MGKPEIKRRLEAFNFAFTDKKERRERGWNGFTEHDTWSFCDYLAFVISEGLKRVRAITEHPSHLTLEEWRSILDEIIVGFSNFEELQHGWPTAKRRAKLDMEFRKAQLLFNRHFTDFWS